MMFNKVLGKDGGCTFSPACKALEPLRKCSYEQRLQIYPSAPSSFLEDGATPLFTAYPSG